MSEGYAKNLEFVGYHDLVGKPAFQMAMQEVGGRYYLYCASYRAAGWAVLEVSDPAHPRYIRFIDADVPTQGCPKIQVGDGIMVTAMDGGFKPGPEYRGIYIWDVKTDPEDPRLLGKWSTGANGGVHRFFYNGGRYVHLSAGCKGFAGNIYRIVDIADPANPVEVGRWWWPTQWTAGCMPPKQMPTLFEMMDLPALHGAPYVKGDLAYLSYSGAGMVILDISDITLPKLVGNLRHQPPFSGKNSGARCHTTMPLSQRPLAIMTSEGERFPLFTPEIVQGGAQPANFIGMVDVSDPSDPTLIAVFPYPEVPEGFPYKNFNEIGGFAGPFGPHNIHEPHDNPALEDRNDRLYCCYFHAGLRVYDISDRFVPKEIAYYIPPNPKKWLFGEPMDPKDPHFDLFQQPPGPMIATTEDIVVDKRGNIFIDTFHDGIYVLRCTV
ncbi:MAG: hypothetical protein JW990_14175 [Thermoleophilia bacterium]|nr:hypothetical protein [Thermoleophilia bacterium]